MSETLFAQGREAIRQIKAARQPIENKAAGVAEVLRNMENATNGFFVCSQDGEFYHFNGMTGALFKVFAKPLVLADDFFALINMRYHLFRDELTKFVIDRLHSFARSQPNRPEIHRFSKFDKENNILYLNRYNGTVYRIDHEGVTIVQNGRDVLFLNDDGGVTIEADIGRHNILQNAIAGDLQYVGRTAGGLTPEQQKTLIYLWMHALPFTELVRAGRPILVFEGQKGSGKTIAVSRIQMLIKGQQRLLNIGKKTDEEDFSVSLLRNPLCVLDNLDEANDWLPNALAAYATGAEWVRRKRFTDTDEVRVSPRAFLAITARNPVVLYRDDVVDRIILIRLERRENQSGFLTEEFLTQQVVEHRNRLYGEYIYNLQQFIRIRVENPPDNRPVPHRLSDFAKLAYQLGVATLQMSRDEVDNILKLAQAERNEFLSESDWVGHVIEKWLEYPENIRNLLRVSDLYDSLKNFCDNNALNWRFKSVMTFSKYLRDNLDLLKRKFEITQAFLRNAAAFSFALRSGT